MDDSSRAVAISLKDCLERVRTEDIVRPVNFRQRTGHQLKRDHNPLQTDMDAFKSFTTRNEFQINEKKSCIMIFNFSKSLDFDPRFIIGDSDELSVVRVSKTLGVIMSDDLRWEKHVEYICHKATSRIWILRRLMEVKMNYEFILECYFKEIRSILEYGAITFSIFIN